MNFEAIVLPLFFSSMLERFGYCAEVSLGFAASEKVKNHWP